MSGIVERAQQYAGLFSSLTNSSAIRWANTLSHALGVVADWKGMSVVSGVIFLDSQTPLHICFIQKGFIQACAQTVRQYGIMSTVRTIFYKRIFEFWQPYYTVQVIKYGTVYSTVPSWHCQCKFGARLSST